jgi:uncharacterized phage protein (TIGR01671 family)
MSREIKFRYWESSHKIMNYDCGVLPNGTNASKSVSSNGIFINPKSQKEDFLMQFTGLKDKNGKEIYEGDIVQFQTVKAISETTTKAVIEYEVQAAQYWAKWHTGKAHRYHVLQANEGGGSGYFDTTMEVIGNIHQNPDLLK